MKQVLIPMPWKPLDVWFIGDIQWAGVKQGGTALSHLKQTLKDALAKEQEGHIVRFLNMGDTVDFASPSNRARLKAANLYDTALDVIDHKAEELCDEIVDLALKPTKGKWLGWVEGHHLHEFKDGTTTDMRLCEMLDAQFLGTTGLLNLSFARGTARIPVVIWFHHGVGNGQTGYYPLGRLEKVAAAWEGVDVFAIGHTTKKAAEWTNKCFPRWSHGRSPHDVSHRKVTLLGTGGYSKYYVEGAMQGRIPRGGYAEQRMLAPAIIGSPVVHILPRRSCVGGEDRISVDITAEG